MELRHFHSFIAVAEELNFTKAARRLQMAQPPVSRHIRDLETELGVKLFERNSSRVFLTDAGRGFLNEVRVVLQHVSQAVEAARQAGSGGAGTVRLGIGKGLGDVVSRIVNEYLRLFPRVEIDVRDIASGFQTEAFVDRKIDVGFMRSPIDAPQLVSAPLFQEQFSVVLRKSSPLARHKVVRLRDLAHEVLLLIDRRISPGAYDLTLALFREQNIEPKVVPTATMPYEEAGSILVDSGKGIYLAVGRNPIHPSFIDRLIALPLKEASAVIEVRVVWRRDEQAKQTLDFVQFTRNKFEKKEGFEQDQNISGTRRSKRRNRSHPSATIRGKTLRRTRKKR
jgi:DNA-binding transcriptional LysR family regulator